jgi:hypothetical protein
MATTTLDSAAWTLALTSQALASGEKTASSERAQSEGKTVRPDMALMTLPRALVAVWKNFAMFEAGSKKDGKLTKADLQQVVLKQPGSQAGQLALLILVKPSLLKQFEGATSAGLLAKIAALVQASYAYLDGVKKDGITWADVTKARGPVETMDWNANKEVRLLLAQNKDVFTALAGKDGVIQSVDLTRIISAQAQPSPAPVASAIALVQAWNAFSALDAGTGGKANGTVTLKELKDLAAAAETPAALKKLAGQLAADPKMFAALAGKDGALSRAELLSAVARGIKAAFKALDVVKTGDGISTADLKALIDPRSAAYKKASAATRAYAKALAGAPSLLKSLSDGKAAITMARLDALIQGGSVGRDLRAIAADALVKFNKLDVSRNKSVSMAELNYILEELKPNSEMAKLVREVMLNFKALSGGDKQITQADLQRIAGVVPR